MLPFLLRSEEPSAEKERGSMFTHVNHTSFFHSTLQRFDFHPSRNTSALCLKRCSQWRRSLATRPQRTVTLTFGLHSLGHGSSRQTLMPSGFLSRHSPMVLSRVWHRTFLCSVPFPHVTEHCKQATPFTSHSQSQGLNEDTQPRGRRAYLRPGSHPPLGGAGVAVAGPAGFRPVVVAVFVVDGARGVVL